MNVTRFFEHWSIVDNPFRAEEARHDPVFARLRNGHTAHPDFEKILGDPAQPSTAVVFGEKGSGKTAIRLQLAQRFRAHNQAHPDARTMFVAHDDLNPMLDRFAQSVGTAATKDGKHVQKALADLRLVDHMDAILHGTVAPLVDQLLGLPGENVEPVLGDEDVKHLRRAPLDVKRDLLLLAALYDRQDRGGERLIGLRRRIGGPRNGKRTLWKTLAVAGALLPAGVLWLSYRETGEVLPAGNWQLAFWIALGLWGLCVVKYTLWDRVRFSLLARRVKKQLRTVPRGRESLGTALAMLPGAARVSGTLPLDGSDEHRDALFGRLRRVLAAIGCRGIVIVLDRVDEPSLVNGEPARMRAIVWPLLNHKFLQQDGLGVKMLLPLELRHELFRESADFFQEARLDKQNMVERLSWTGAMLYELCKQRLNACRADSAEPIGLVDLFSEEVTRQDLVDALDQMHQPRDAFKFLYQCIQEHCSNVTEEQEQWRIPKLVLDAVRKQQSERVQMMYRGVRPA